MPTSIGVNINNQPVTQSGMGAMMGSRSQRDKCIFAGIDGELPPFQDQHGRLFEAQCDIDTMQPIEELRCVSHSPPWLPPMPYARFGRKGSSKVVWQYRALARNIAGTTGSWYAEARKFAQRNNLPVPDVGGEVDPMLVDVFGYPPISPEIALTAEAGHPWLLGVKDAEKDTDLESLLVQGRSGNASDALATIEKRVRAKLGPLVYLGDDPNPQMPVPTDDPEEGKRALAAMIEEMVESRVTAMRKTLEVEATEKAKVQLAARQAQAAKMRAAKHQKQTVHPTGG